MKKFLMRLFSPITLVVIFLLFQISALVLSFLFISSFPIITTVLDVLVIIVALIIVNSKSGSSYKISWFFLIVVLPFFGTVLYLLFGNKKFTKRQTQKITPKIKFLYDLSNKTSKHIGLPFKEENSDAEVISNYINKYSGSSIFGNTKTTYYKWGDDAFPIIIEKLKLAKHYIFLEYFIIEEGKFWDSILEVLIQKVEEGVDVRLLYDDFGCLNTLPTNYDKKLRKLGIKCEKVNKIRPILDIRVNNRDHRKILVIDGYIGFTGGINIADEYINEKTRFGVWKDNCIMLEGEGVSGLTNLFLSMWIMENNEKQDIVIDNYIPNKYINEYHKISSKGYIQPYGSFPFTYETVSENVYVNLILKAKKYVWIMTPYLILDEQLENALSLAAKSGIDVRIIIPHIPDKKLVFELSKSYAEKLILSGVKIFEFAPGFVHSKTVLVDGNMATVGTVNFDYRSLYLHFENGVFLYKCDCLKDIEEDFNQTFLVSKEIRKEDIQNLPFFKRVLRFILNVFAPLL